MYRITYITLFSLLPCSLLYNPKGLLALPFFTVLPVIPGREAMFAAPPVAPVDNPRGFPFVVARLPAAPVMSLIELPYSRTMSPQVLDVFAILYIISTMQTFGFCRNIPRTSALSSSSNAISGSCNDRASSISYASNSST